jgi:hypothetical protein
MCSDKKGTKGKSQDANLTRKNFFEPNMSHYKSGGIRGKVKVQFCFSAPRRYTGSIAALILNLSTRQR